MEGEQCTVDTMTVDGGIGRWTVNGGLEQWTVNSRLWTVDSGRWTALCDDRPVFSQETAVFTNSAQGFQLTDELNAQVYPGEYVNADAQEVVFRELSRTGRGVSAGRTASDTAAEAGPIARLSREEMYSNYTFCCSNSARTRPFYNLRIRCSSPANLSIRTAF